MKIARLSYLTSHISYLQSHISHLVSICLLLTLTVPVFAQRASDEALAMQYYQNGEFDKAVVIYEKFFEKVSNPQLYYDQYLNSLIKLKRYTEAEKVVKKMSKIYPENYAYRIDFARILQEQGQQDKANDLYNSLIRNLPKDEFAIRDLSTAFYRSSRYDLAIKVFLNGRKALNDDFIFAFDLISLYRFQKNKSMLVEEYLNLLAHPEYQIQVIHQAKNAFSSIFETVEDYEILRVALLRKLQKDPQNIAYSDLLAWQYLQREEYNLALKQVIALDKRLKEEGDRVFELCLMLIGNKSYQAAIDGLQYLLSKGKENRFYIPARIQLLNTKNKLLTDGKYTQSELLQIEKEYLSLLTELGRNHTTTFAISQLANLQAYFLQKPAEATVILEEAIKIPNLPSSALAQIKLDLGDIYILTGEVWEAALIYGQVEKAFTNEPAGHEAKFRGARLSFFQGEFAWAKAQLDVLKSSTSNLIANDAMNLSLLIQENTMTLADTNALKKYAVADLLIFKNQTGKALSILDSIPKLFPGNSLVDDILMAKARIYLKEDNVQEAINQLTAIVDDYKFDLWADDALFMLGDIYETKLKDPEKAKLYFQQIITDFPGSLHVAEARKRFRNLRGDNIG